MYTVFLVQQAGPPKEKIYGEYWNSFRKNKQTQRTERILTKSGSSMDWIAVKHCYRLPESPTGKISSL